MEIETDPRKKRRTPSIEGMRDPAQRARILHTLANHELQALELFAWALLRFPGAGASFRRGLLEILGDEQLHFRLYLGRLRAHGLEFGDLPLSGYFWSKAHQCDTPLRFVCSMALTFENANLDHALALEDAAREAGDMETAAVLRRVHDDEVRHVRFGWRWLRALKDPGQTMTAAWLENVVWPLRPALARGDRFHPESRIRAGIDDHEFLRMLERAERPRALYRFARSRRSGGPAGPSSRR